MEEYKKIVTVLLLAVFTVIVGIIVAECAMSEITGRAPNTIIEAYDFLIGNGLAAAKEAFQSLQ
jgi:hypothetical protein